MKLAEKPRLFLSKQGDYFLATKVSLFDLACHSGEWDNKRGSWSWAEIAHVWRAWERDSEICGELHSIQRLFLKRWLLHLCQPCGNDRTRRGGIVFYLCLWSGGGDRHIIHGSQVCQPWTLVQGLQTRLCPVEGAVLGHTTGLSQTCRQRGAPTRLVKVAPEQIISTSNLNILKSKNNIESCRSYYKVLLH